jgi:stage IV sporulation protein FB
MANGRLPARSASKDSPCWRCGLVAGRLLTCPSRSEVTMLLSEPQPGRWELRGRLFGAELRIRPLFWPSCVLMGVPYYQDPDAGGMGAFTFWIAAVLISMLAHEAAHIIAARLFGIRPRIVLSGLGGQVYGLNDLKRWRRVLVLLAGPLGNLLIYAVLRLIIELTRLPVEQLGAEWSNFIGNAVFISMLINALWCLLNALPLWPLDGGRIALEVGEALLGTRGQTLALLLSLLVCFLMSVFVVGWARLSLTNPFDKHYLIYLIFFGIMALYCYIFWLITFRALWGDSAPLDESTKSGRAA